MIVRASAQLRHEAKKSITLVGIRIAPHAKPLVSRLVLFSLAVGVLFLALIAPGAGNLRPDSDTWETALGTAAQIIGGATAIVFALLLVPVQNAAGRYSPIFLRYIWSDRELRVVFGWTVFALAYALACLGLGVTLWRVAATGLLTVTVFFFLAEAARRVMLLLDPIELSRIVESDALADMQTGVRQAEAQFLAQLSQIHASTGISLTGHPLARAPAPQAVIDHLLRQVQPLLSITGSAIETGQVDVVEGVLSATTRLYQTYLGLRGTNATADDPLTSRLSEELFRLAMAAQHTTSLRVLPEVIRALGRVADAGVKVSTPGLGIEQQNVAAMPIGYLQRIALANLSNVDSVAPGLAAQQLCGNVFGLFERGLPAAVAGEIEDHLSPLMQLALRPYGYQVAGITGSWLMRMWAASGSRAGGDLVQDPIVKLLRQYLPAYRASQPSIERRTAIAPLVAPTLYPGSTALPAGAAAAAGLSDGDWPPNDESVENIRWLGDCLDRELVWPAASGEWDDILNVRYAGEQVVEIAALLAAVASETLNHPSRTTDASHAEEDDGDDGVPRSYSYPPRGDPAEGWWWLTSGLLGACSGLTGGNDEHPRRANWDALNNATGCILAALASLEQGDSSALRRALESVLDDLYRLGEDSLSNRPGATEIDGVFPYIRMIGAWLLASGHADLAQKAASILARAPADTGSILHRRGPWLGLYPQQDERTPWRQPYISVVGQKAVPSYLASHDFMGDEARQRFEEVVAQLRGGQAKRRRRGRRPV